jgi:hypothetical protein
MGQSRSLRGYLQSHWVHKLRDALAVDFTGDGLAVVCEEECESKCLFGTNPPTLLHQLQYGAAPKNLKFLVYPLGASQTLFLMFRL